MTKRAREDEMAAGPSISPAAAAVAPNGTGGNLLRAPQVGPPSESLIATEGSRNVSTANEPTQTSLSTMN